MDLEGANFIVAPSHGLEGGIIVAQLTLTAQEVLALKDSHTALSVVLQGAKIHQLFLSQMRHFVKLKEEQTEGRLCSTHSTGNRPEGGQPLNVIGVAAPESITLGVLSPLQHKLLSLEGGVLITNPAEERKKRVNYVHDYKWFFFCFFSLWAVLSLTLRSPP